jgi:hypothetical protein
LPGTQTVPDERALVPPIQPLRSMTTALSPLQRWRQRRGELADAASQRDEIGLGRRFCAVWPDLHASGRLSTRTSGNEGRQLPHC